MPRRVALEAGMGSLCGSLISRAQVFNVAAWQQPACVSESAANRGGHRSARGSMQRCCCSTMVAPQPWGKLCWWRVVSPED
jgi:hypothetical protein